MLNPMMLQAMARLMSSPNPMQAMSSMFGGNPAFLRAQQMAQGKSPAQLRQTLFSLAAQRGVSPEQLHQMAAQFKIKL